jgi:pyruvate,orthophosphate dikinase
MEETMPEVFQQLLAVTQQLENHYKDMQDIEFTVQNGKLWILQTRSGKRSTKAAIKIAIDLVNEGILTKKEAIKRIAPESLDQLLHPTIDSSANYNVIDKALPASPGAASGKVVFSANEAEHLASKQQKVILVRIETSPEDIHGMSAAQGILTSRGGMTSHAAVVARGMGKPCVCGASSLLINYQQKTITKGDVVIKEGDLITINGSTGEVILGEVKTIEPTLSEDFKTLMQWTDEIRTLRIRTNAETPFDAETARKFGAEGIGLCRTEHMFFDENRINIMREMILSDNVGEREQALTKLLPMQRDDFTKLFTIMAGLPVNIRLLDPPLHEFLPHNERDIQTISQALGVSVEKLVHRAQQLHEQNPMLGHRGCRLGIAYPEIYKMQAQAIFEAMVATKKNSGQAAIAEIMLPLIMTGKEFIFLKEIINNVAAEVESTHQMKLEYLVGTMIELPRAALRAGEIAEHAEFFSFGTNDLTQTTLGISRDDSASFLQIYQNKGIIEHDPFVHLDEDGVGELISIAVERGRKVNPGLKVGICGEHGGDPRSITFCHRLGLNYVSCSPYRVPIAKLAAAQACLLVS